MPRVGSAHDDAESRDHFLRSGCDLVLVKPVTRSELRAAIDAGNADAAGKPGDAFVRFTETVRFHGQNQLADVMNEAGRFIEVQGTAEGHAFSDDEFQSMLGLARLGIDQVIELQNAILASTV